MALVAQFGNIFAIAVVGALVWFYMRGRFEQTDRRIDEVKQDQQAIRAELRDLRADFDRRFELLMAELNAVRSDLTHVALAVGAHGRPEANPA